MHRSAAQRDETTVSELRIAFFVQAQNLAVQRCGFGTARQSKREIEIRKGFEIVAVTRHQFATAILDVCQRAKSIPLDLEEPIGMVERLSTAAQRHGLEQHL